MANHAGDAQAALGQQALFAVVAAVEIGVGDDGAACNLIERNVFSREIGRTGDHHSMTHARRILQCPAQGLHASQTAAHHSGQRFNTQCIEQLGLGIDPVLHRDHWKICAINLAGVGVGLHRAGRTKARAKVVNTNDKEMIGIDRLAGADHGVPPALGPGQRLPSFVQIDAGHMVRGIEGVADQNRIRLAGV